jgi:hypothetical protein
MSHFSKIGNCAILVFAKSAVCENESKRILDSSINNMMLWSTLNNNVLKITQKSKIPFFVVNESAQTGLTFGQKISNAINNIFNEGYEKVIVIGNDCPELKTQHLHLVQDHLQKNDFVFGPDYSGGDYILGISKNKFNKLDWENFDWQTRNLHKNLISFFANETVFLLPFLNDINSSFSFKKAIYQLPYNSYLKNILLCLSYKLHYVFCFIEHKFSTSLLIILNYRGPPSLIRT